MAYRFTDKCSSGYFLRRKANNPKFRDSFIAIVHKSTLKPTDGRPRFTIYNCTIEGVEFQANTLTALRAKLEKAGV